MSEISEIVSKLNNLKILQTSSDLIENLEEADCVYFEKQSEEGLEVNTHRWYETAISVFEYEGEFIGVRSVTNSFSEQSSIEDFYYHLKFYEMEEILKVSYKTKAK